MGRASRSDPRAQRVSGVAVVSAGLTGRDTEWAALRQLADQARAGHSQVLVIRGEAGIGKTALLDQLAATATDFELVRTAGVESDMELAYAGLQQLCAPLMDRTAALPEPQREALDIAFGRSTGNAPDRFLVGLAVLGLFSAAAGNRPLCALVDDAQWLDRASAQTLGFVARRLPAEPIMLVCGLRTPVDALIGLPKLTLRGLADTDARALLQAALPGPIDPQVTDRIVAETHGNPLALVELPRGLSPAELAGGYYRLDIQPVAGQIEDHFLAQVRALPADTQRLLLVAAAEPVGDVALLLRAADASGLDPTAMDPAVQAGLIEVGMRVRFRHPLVRSAIYRAADGADRRAAHGALATTTDPSTDPDRRAWHRAYAAIGPDESVAADLERSADRARLRGGTAAAAAFLARAAELTPDGATRGARALDAAEAARAAADLEVATGLLATAELTALDERQRARVARMRAQLAFSRGRGSGDAPALIESVRQFFAAARSLADFDAPAAQETLLEAVSAAMYTGRLFGVRVRQETASALVADTGAGPARVQDLLLRALTVRISQGSAAGVAPMRAAIAAVTPQAWSWQAFPIAHEAVVHDLWDDAAWHRIATDAVHIATDTGALAMLPTALMTRAGVHVQSGEFDVATTLLTEAAALSAAVGHTPVRYHELALAAWRGDEPQATALIDAAVRDGAARGEGRVTALVGYATGVLRNGLGQYRAALSELVRACEYEDLGLYGWNLVELVEAGVRADEPSIAAEAAAALDERTRGRGTDWALGVRARSQALLADGEAADEGYVEAIDRLGRTRIAVQLARTHLLYGEWLRRVNRRNDARAQLRTAHQMFAAMGAQAFAERSRRELQATGQKTRREPTAVGDALTPQERQIAERAAAGLTNAEIAAQLFLSAHTVEWHLRKIFVKLAIRSRRELRGIIAGP